MKKISCIPFLLLATACNPLVKAESECKQEMIACKEQYDQHIIKTCGELAQCTNSAITKVENAGYPYPDLLEYNKAARVSICQKVDNHKMSFEDATLQMTQIQMQIVAEAQQRQALESQQRSNGLSSFGNFMQGMAAYQQVNQPRQPVTCISSPPFTRCQ